MAEAFDPYYKWLGIEPKDQPANHYRLLGIPLLIGDPDVIANAADRQMAHVRTFQSGAHGKLSQQLLNEMAVARVCLLDRERKAEYDSSLRSVPSNAGGERLLTSPSTTNPTAPSSGLVESSSRLRPGASSATPIKRPPPRPNSTPASNSPITATAPAATPVDQDPFTIQLDDSEPRSTIEHSPPTYSSSRLSRPSAGPPRGLSFVWYMAAGCLVCLIVVAWWTIAGREQPRPIANSIVAPRPLSPVGNKTVVEPYKEQRTSATVHQPDLDVRRVLADLKSNDPEVRKAAAIQAARIGRLAKGGVPDLAVMLEDKDEALRRAAADALRQMGPDAKMALPALIKALSGDSNIRESVIGTLALLGSDAQAAVPKLTELLYDENVQVRLGAAGALHGMGAGGAECRAMLVKLLNHRAPRVRERAAHCLGDYQASAKEAVPGLLVVLGDQKAFGYVRAAAVHALGKIDPQNPAVVAALTKALSDKRKGVRQAAAKELQQKSKN